MLDVDALVVAAAVVALRARGRRADPARDAAGVLRAGAAARGGARVTALVQIEDVFRVYPSPEGGVAALQGLSLAVEQGELCVVLGPSGSGKSTLLRIVAGFDRASAGSVRVAGVDVGALGGWGAARFRSRAIGYADQHYWRALAGELTARELVGSSSGWPASRPRAARARADELLERVGPRRPPRRASARALRRRAAADRALRGARGPARAPDRRRADRRARRRDRARGARADRRARARVRQHGARRQPRPRVGRAWPTASSTSATAASPTSGSRARPATARSSSAAAAGSGCPRTSSAPAGIDRHASAELRGRRGRPPAVGSKCDCVTSSPARSSSRRELVLQEHKPRSSLRAG